MFAPVPGARGRVEVVSALFSLNRFRRIKLDAESVLQQYNALGRPLSDVGVVHVAGTNGKGSVCWKIASALQASGARTGLFVSPHVSSFRERIRVNGELIGEDAVTELVPRVCSRFTSQGLEPSFFEVVAMAAALHFREQGCDAAVIETGLGGRLDATTAFDADVCSITSIGHDHARVLGSTLPVIAREKAGIARRGVPLVVAPMPAYVSNVVSAVAGAVGAPVRLLPPRPTDGARRRQSTRRRRRVLTPLGPPAGADFDAENAEVARASLRAAAEAHPGSCFARVDDAHLARGLAARPPCRDERFWVSAPGASRALLLLDAAHNAHGLHSLFRRLRAAWGGDGSSLRLHVVYGAASGKDMGGVGRAMWEAAARGEGLELEEVHVVQAAHPRAAGVDLVAGSLAQAASGRDVSRAGPVAHSGMDSVARGIRAALGIAPDAPLSCARAGDGERAERAVLVCGSLFLMPEARAAIGIREPRDDPAVVGASTAEAKRASAAP